MKTVFFTTVENQLRDNGSFGLLYDHFTAEQYGSEKAAKEEAEAKYFTICAAAAKSGIPYHEALLLQSDMGIIRQETYDRRTNKPEETEQPQEEPATEPENE